MTLFWIIIGIIVIGLVYRYLKGKEKKSKTEETLTQPQTSVLLLKRKVKKRWVLGGIVLLIIFIAIISGGGEEKKETTPEQQLPQEQTQPQETSQTSQAEQQYIQEILKINQDVSDAMKYISNLSQTKPLPVLWTEQEIITAAAHTVMIELSYESAQELDPPDKFKSTHAFLLSGLSKYAEAMPIFRSGVDNLDADKIQQSANLIAEGVQLINQATQEVNKVR